jgi:hypothetical protein
VSGVSKTGRAAALVALIAAALVAACSSFGGARQLETRIGAGVEKFHAQLNEGRFSEIYAQADEYLRRAESEEAFVRRLAGVRGRTGTMTGKALVVIPRDFKSDVRQFFSRGEMITHRQTTGCDAGHAVELFQWTVRGGQVRLANYELERILERGKNHIYGIGPG